MKSHQERICRKSVTYPTLAFFLGGPCAAEAEKILRTKFGYTDRQIKQLQRDA